MRPLRRLLERSLLAPFLLLPLLSCGNPRPSEKAVTTALGHSSTFIEPKMVVIPRRIDARTPASFGGGALDDRQLSTIDPVVAILHANKMVDVQDIYGPDPGTGGYSHIISISPASGTSPELFTETDEPGTDPTWQHVRKTPGWRVTLGRRELLNVWQIADSNSPNEKLSPGYVIARFDFRWIPSDIGKLFDQGALGFDDLSRDLQVASVSAADLDSRATYKGQAWLTRDKTGEWKVTMFDCRRCSTQS
jgi:hypothetical protein